MKRGHMGIIVGVVLILFGVIPSRYWEDIVSMKDLFIAFISIIGLTILVLSISCGNFEDDKF